MCFEKWNFPDNYLSFFREHKFKLLTPIVKSTDQIILECSCGNIFKKSLITVSSDIRNNKHLCTRCRLLVALKELVNNKGGAVLSARYITNTHPLEFKCSNANHPSWMAPPNRIINGNWCKLCLHDKLRGQIDVSIKKEAEELAVSRGGILLTYAGSTTPATWKCSEGHIWTALLSNVRRGNWCSECGSGLYEQICRSHFEQLFAAKFPKQRPAWLTSDVNAKMELDGYCEELGIAFEHQGMYHYSECAYFPGMTLERRKFLDQLKREKCLRHNVVLIEVPSLVTITPIKELKQFILNECEKINISIPCRDINIDFKDCYKLRKPTDLVALEQVLQIKKGKLLSEYISMHDPITIECGDCNHIWTTTTESIKKDTWCPECAINKRRHSIDIEFCNQYQLEDLTMKEYSQHLEKRQWKCKICSLIFESSPRNIKKRNYGCPQCNK